MPISRTRGAGTRDPRVGGIGIPQAAEAGVPGTPDIPPKITEQANLCPTVTENNKCGNINT